MTVVDTRRYQRMEHALETSSKNPGQLDMDPATRQALADTAIRAQGVDSGMGILQELSARFRPDKIKLSSTISRR